MAHLLEDPRLRQRWNQISHTTETVTENAAAGIYSFQHRYITPCLASLGDAIEPCLTPCFGDRDERMRRAQYHHSRPVARQAEYTFDFYDDWDDDDELLASGGGLGAGRGEDWDRLVGGGGSGLGGAAGAGEVADQQPRRKRGMSYGTRGAAMRRKAGDDSEDPTIIPSTAPLGFLSRLPWKIGGTLRYKPSAAFLQDHPGGGERGGTKASRGENQPLLLEEGDERGEEDDDDDDEDEGGFGRHVMSAHMRKRSGTSGSGDTSDSFRSRGDLFPSDGEEYEVSDALEIDDEFAMALARVDNNNNSSNNDRASSSGNTRSSKGKRPAGSSRKMSRAASGTTLSSSTSKSSLRRAARRAGSNHNNGNNNEPSTPGYSSMEGSMHSILAASSIEDLQREEAEVERLEDQEVARKREAATRIARERGLSLGEGDYDTGESESRAKSAMFRVEEISEPGSPRKMAADEAPGEQTGRRRGIKTKPGNEGPLQEPAEGFIPARLPNFR